MIRKIHRVRDYRVFSGWQWPAGTSEFERVNLIYGINGSGKSTLGCLLADAVDDAEWNSGLDAQVVGADGIGRRARSAGDGIWREIRVFNRDYVEENLRFDAPDGGAAEGLLVLGKQSIADRAERERGQKRLAEIQNELPGLQERLRKARNLRDRMATDTARELGERLGGIDGRYASRRYTAKQVKEAIGRQSDDGLLAGHSAEQDAAMLTEESRAAIKMPTAESYSLSELAGQVREILRESATAIAITDLTEHPVHARWVQAGMALHEERADCIFCTNTISAERRAALAAHFDSSVREQQQRIDLLIRDIGRLQEESEGAVRGLPRRTEILASKQEHYAATLTAIEGGSRQFAEGLNELQRLLQAKRDAPFAAVQEEVAPPVQVLSLSAAARIIEEHNREAGALDARRNDAAKRIEVRRIEEIRREYLQRDGEVRAGEQAIQAREDEQAKLRARLSELAKEDLDPAPLAKTLNRDVAALLGREELQFSVAGDGYRITREGQPAHHLSEGERNAISLLYFLRSLESHGTDAASCIVVIDDPVSSLDGNALVGASAHLWTRLVERDACRQLFLLTHNFELFRMWIGQLEQRGSGTKEPRHEIYEIRCVVRRGENGDARVPVILAWPDDPKLRKRLQSEYHYLFWRVASALEQCAGDPSPTHDMEVAAVMPNVCRRLLEGFLAFKSPSLLGSLKGQVMNVPARSIDTARRARLLRFVHAYSHNETADGSAGAARPEAREMLWEVLGFIRDVDGRHFNEMCRAVGVEVPVAGTG